MGLFDFVKDHDRVRLAADGFGQLTGFIVTNVAWRRANQAAHAVAFHELGHVNLNQGIFRTKHLVRQSLRQLGLTDTGRTKEHEGPDRAMLAL